MLVELRVTNFAIIENVSISFKPGLNILSGETGAGKSIILKSLALLMGQKSSPDAVRNGKEQAVVEGMFDISQRPDISERLENLGIENTENELVVRRVVLSQGKGRIYINNALNTLSTLQEIIAPLIEVTGTTTPLIEMTGQHENKSLLSKSYHLDLLDRASGILKERREYTTLFSEFQRIHKEIQNILSSEKHRTQQLDFLSFQRDEIQASNLSSEKNFDLENQYLRAKNSSKLSEFATTVDSVLTGEPHAVVPVLSRLLQRAQEIQNLDSDLASKLRPLHEACTIINDVCFEIQNSVKNIDQDSIKLETLETQMNRYRRLQRKYGQTPDEILAALDRIETEISDLSRSESRLKEYESQVHELKVKLKQRAHALHDRRSKESASLSKEVNQQLKDLNMKDTLFSIHLEKSNDLNAMGMTEVEFMIQNSPKDIPRSLGKVASGGELSRILLSLKQVMGSSELPRTYLFDEVDTGVSGPTAEKVGRKLNQISKGQQVICVTHLPQVASQGHHHFVIVKRQNSDGAQTEIVELNRTARVKELARLISGEKLTKTSLAHADELLRQVDL